MINCTFHVANNTLSVTTFTAHHHYTRTIPLAPITICVSYYPSCFVLFAVVLTLPWITLRILVSRLQHNCIPLFTLLKPWQVMIALWKVIASSGHALWVAAWARHYVHWNISVQICVSGTRDSNVCYFPCRFYCSALWCTVMAGFSSFLSLFFLLLLLFSFLSLLFLLILFYYYYHCYHLFIFFFLYR